MPPPLKPPANKTKIVCTIGPASSSHEMLAALLEAGMNVARLNFSHGDFANHAQVIESLRTVSEQTGKRVAVMADLPGPKMRIGELKAGPYELDEGDTLVLTTDDIIGDQRRVAVSFPRLPAIVEPGNHLFLNDGLIHLEVKRVDSNDVYCDVLVGGELHARKGLNLPAIDLGISAFTDRDAECLEFALAHGIDAVSQSFVATAADVEAVREKAAQLGKRPFIIAKIERAQALDQLDDILDAADGLMVARGDLGVEIAIEKIAIVQKELMERANLAGKPVITATHMLESMVEHRRPTRAEATDVANAILDGTDCVMLSGESAVGRYPVEATKMLATIAAATESHRRRDRTEQALKRYHPIDVSTVDLIALAVHHTLERVRPKAVIIPTRSGATARNVTRFRLPVWVTALSANEETCRALQFSYGVYPVKVEHDQADWSVFAREWLRDHGQTWGLAVLTQGPSALNPSSSHRMEILELDRPSN